MDAMIMCIKSVVYYSSLSQDALCVERVMANSNKQYHAKRKISYFDACSLYPSAMYCMDGFLEDKPKMLNYRSYEFLANKMYILLGL